MNKIILKTDESQNDEMKIWHDKAIQNTRANINVLASIIKVCPNQNAYRYHKLVGILARRQSTTLFDIAKWHSGIDMEKITHKSLVGEILEKNKG